MSRVHDLTQDDSDSDSGNSKAPPAVASPSSIGLPSTPSFITNRQFNSEADPLNAPLINTSHSTAYALSNSVIDPFSNLIRHLHQSNESNKEIFFQLTQNLATNAPTVSFIDILFQLFENPENPVCSVLALQSLRVLSINNQEFCREVLKRLDCILDKFKDNFISEIMQLFLTIGQYIESKEQAQKIIDAIKKNIDVSKADDATKAQVFSVYAVLSKYGDIFSQSDVEFLRKETNWPGKSPLDESIVWPCYVCIDNFLSQPNTEAYKFLSKDDSEKTKLLGKLAHALICAEKNNDPDLFMMIMKLFLETIDEFKIETTAETLKEFHLQLGAAMITLKDSEDTGLSKMADTILKRLGFIK